jgi:hypothetical protein
MGCSVAERVRGGVLRAVAIGFVSIAMHGCGVTGLPVSGQVLDVSTGKPLPGAIVVVRWLGTAVGPGHSSSVCVHVETAVTDDQGRYATPWWWQKPPVLASSGPVSDAYLAAYEPTREGRPQGASEKDVYMKRFVGTAGERSEFIDGRVFSGMSCLSGTASERNLFLLKRAAYLEAKALGMKESSLHEFRQSAAWSWLARPSDSRALTDDFAALPPEIQKELK